MKTDLKLFLDDERFPEEVKWMDFDNTNFVVLRNGKSFFNLINDLLAKNILPTMICFDHDLGDYQSTYYTLEDELKDKKEKENLGFVDFNKRQLTISDGLRDFYLKYGKNKKDKANLIQDSEITGKSCLEFLIDSLLNKLEKGEITVVDIENMEVFFHTMNLIERDKMISLWNNFIDYINKEYVLNKYQNGNATITIYKDGTRVTEFPENEGIKLEYPMNIDIRLMSKCDFGYNPSTGKSVCSFCHESARTDGKECDYNKLLEVLKDLPQGTELAVGMNDLTTGLDSFLQVCKAKGWIVNGTINQGAFSKRGNQKRLQTWIDNDLIKGVGVSFRPKMPKIPKEIIEHSNTVVHVIVGIDDFYEVKKLAEQGIKKILVLGEKNFGFNKGKVDVNSQSHKTWKENIMSLTKVFDVVSFDNLALAQLNIKKHLPEDMWEEFYQGEHSFYINAVDEYFAPSSRSSILNIPFSETNIKDYFKKLETQIINIRDEN